MGNVSKELTASIFRVVDCTKEETSRGRQQSYPTTTEHYNPK
jgi:hypothetical protein